METIRPYVRTDLPGMVALDAVCFAPAFLFSRSSMRRFAESDGAKTFVIEADSGDLIGFVIVSMEPDPSGLRGYVVTLDVAPAYRRSGIAGQLMQRIEDHAADEGAMWVELHVWEQNEVAIRFYEARDYRRIGVYEGFYGRGMDAYVYEKKLQTRHAP